MRGIHDLLIKAGANVKLKNQFGTSAIAEASIIGSAPIIDALRKNIEMFIDSLNKGDANNAAPVKDWRGAEVHPRPFPAPPHKNCS